MKTIPIQIVAEDLLLHLNQINNWYFCLDKYLREIDPNSHAIKEIPMVDGTLVISLYKLDSSIYLHPTSDGYQFYTDAHIDDSQYMSIEKIARETHELAFKNVLIEFQWYAFIKLSYKNSDIKLLKQKTVLEEGLTLHPAGTLSETTELVRLHTLTEAIKYPANESTVKKSLSTGTHNMLGLCAVSSTVKSISWDMALVEIHAILEKIVNFLGYVFNCPVGLFGDIVKKEFSSDVDYSTGDNSLEGICTPEFIELDDTDIQNWQSVNNSTLLSDTTCLFHQSLHNMDHYPSISQFGFASIIEAIGTSLQPPTTCPGHDGDELIHCESCQLKTGARRAFLTALELVTNEENAREIRKKHYDLYRSRFAHESQMLSYSNLPFNPRYRLVIKNEKDEYNAALRDIRYIAHSVLTEYLKVTNTD